MKFRLKLVTINIGVYNFKERRQSFNSRLSNFQKLKIENVIYQIAYSYNLFKNFSYI